MQRDRPDRSIAIAYFVFLAYFDGSQKQKIQIQITALFHNLEQIKSLICLSAPGPHVGNHHLNLSGT